MIDVVEKGNEVSVTKEEVGASILAGIRLAEPILQHLNHWALDLQAADFERADLTGANFGH